MGGREKLQISVLLFAGPRELLGLDRVTLHVDPPTVGRLRAALVAVYPALAPLLPSCVFAVEEALVAPEAEHSHALRPKEEVALIPPVSGG